MFFFQMNWGYFFCVNVFMFILFIQIIHFTIVRVASWQFESSMWLALGSEMWQSYEDVENSGKAALEKVF